MRPMIVFISITLLLLATSILSLRMGAIPLPWSALMSGWHSASEHHYLSLIHI